MPVLPLLNDAGELDRLAGVWLQAVMFFPNDEDARDRFIGALGKRIIVEVFEQEDRWPCELSKDVFTLLVDAPSPKYFERHEKAIRQRGFCAGHWLWHMIIVHVHHPEHASNLKWQYLMSNYVLKKHNEKNPGDRWAISDQSIFSFRNEFLPVAHLWAAERMFKDMGTVEYLYDNNVLLHFLSCSEAFRQAANKLRLFDGLKCGLQPEDAWIPPPELALVLPPGRAKIEPLLDEALDVLAGYVSPPTRAKRKKKGGR